MIKTKLFVIIFYFSFHNSDLKVYTKLWEGTMVAGDIANIPDIARYNTYAIVSATYPMALWGMRWGTSIMAFGADWNADNAIRVASLRITISGTQVSLVKSRIQNMTTGILTDDFPISQIFGIS